jgi:peptidoglycan hydrolase-like protein with peptidoglycan-binding domain
MMNLQGRNLSPRMSGADVALLQSELRQLGYAIAEAETSAQVYGATTQQAVREFQRTHGLDPTGIVDERTAARINAQVDAQRPPPEPEPGPRPEPEPTPEPPPFVVRGIVQSAGGKPFAAGLVRAYDVDMRSEEDLEGAG